VLIIDDEFKRRIPPLSESEFTQLEKNILEYGCRDPLVVWDGSEGEVLLDGHNRHAICTKHGIKYQTKKIKLDGREQALEWIDKNQIGRRNLHPEAFRLILGRIYNSTKSTHGGDRGNQHSKPSGKNCHMPKTSEVLAERHGVSERTVRNAGKAASAVDGTPLAGAVMRGEVRLNEAAKIAPVIKKAADENKTLTMDEAREIIKAEQEAERARKRAERQAAIEAQRKAIEEAPSLNEQTENAGLFDVIVLDPPWAYGREYDPQGSRVANPYPEMSQAELLEIEPPAKDDAVIFLWTTHQFIFDAKGLLDKWGFTYKATLVWNKEKIGMGRWLRMQCEFCLVGVKGKPFWENTTWRDIIHEPRREHSRKPEAFYEMVEAITAGRKLEYFARSKREGWEVLGNDTSKF